MKYYFFVMLLLTGCSKILGLDKLDKTDEYLRLSNIKIECLGEMIQIPSKDIVKAVGPICSKSEACIGKYLDKWEDECIKRHSK